MTTEKMQSADGEAPASASLAHALEDRLRKDKAKKFRKGDRVHGRVMTIGETMAFVDLDGKAEGMIDLTDLRKPDGSLDLIEGQHVDGIVTDVAANGVLIKRAIGLDTAVEQLKAAQAAGLPVQAKVTGLNKGGLELELFDLRAFCPASQIDVHKADDLAGYIGQTFTFGIVEVADDGKRIVLSRRVLMKEDEEKRIAETKAKIVPGAVLKGRVARVQQYGAFIDLGGIEGLVHMTEMSRGHLRSPADIVKEGQEVDVQVLRLEDTTDKAGKKVERIALSMKALEKDPWEGVAARFPVGSKVKGKIARLQPFGAFVELAPGIDGLAHVSTLSDKRIEHPREAVKEGDEVEAWVLAVEPEKQRISLSVREPRKAEESRPPRRAQTDEARPPRRAQGDESRPPRRAPAADARNGAPREARPPRPERGPEDRPPRRPRPESTGEGGHDAPRRSPFSIGSLHDTVVEKIELNGVYVTLPSGGGTATVPFAELGVTVSKTADARAEYTKLFPVGSTLRVAIVESRSGVVKASKVEAERADDRAMIRDWATTQKKANAGKEGFGTFADLLRKSNLVK